MNCSASKSHVYHYTDVNALVSILQARELWFSDASCLNDSSDGIYMPELYRDAAAQLLLEMGDDPQGVATHYLTLVQKNPYNFHWQQFVCCFSNNPDSSNQWINYGAAGPYCITFDRVELAEAVKELAGRTSKYSFWDGEVDYDGKQVVLEMVRTKLQNFLDSAADHNVDPKSRAMNHTDWVPESLHLMDSIRFKHSSWRNEEEYRIAISPPQWSDDRARHSADSGCWLLHLPRRAFIKPTAVLRFGPKFLTMIKGIKVGPGPAADIAQKTLRRMLKTLGYKVELNGKEADVPVLLSECGYRSP
jgi:hypothetical protein